MTYNILDDENRWQERYKVYLFSLTMTQLLKELNYVVSMKTGSLEELIEMKTRVNLISLVVAQKYEDIVSQASDLAGDGGG